MAIVARNEASQIDSLFQNLRQELSSEVLEVLWVDNASTDDSLKRVHFLAPLFPCPIRILRQEHNHMARARNRALAEAKTPWVYFLDADCRLHPGALHRLTERVRCAPPKVGALGGPNSPPSPARNAIQEGLWALSQHRFAHLGSPQATSSLPEGPTAHLPSCHLAIRVSAAQQVGGFHMDFDRAGEDLSFSLALTAQSFQILFFPDIGVEHHQGQGGLGPWLRKMKIYGEAQAALLSLFPRSMGFRRWVPPLTMLGALLTLAGSPQLFALGFVLYLGALAVGLRNGRAPLGPVCFIALTHLSYGWGIVLGTLKLARRNLMRLPQTIPALEKK